MSDLRTVPPASASVALTSPAPPEARVVLVDVVRGFALFGVLLANMVWTSQYFALTPAQREALPTAGPDLVAGLLVAWLVDGKFYTLFSVLFGLGFAVQLSRAAGRGQDLVPTYVRRLAVLFLIGAAHALLIWFGDILHIYAVVGFVLILFRNRSDHAVLGAAAGVATAASLLPFAQWLLIGADTPGPAGDVEPHAARFAALTAGGWSDIVRVNWAFNRDDYRGLLVEGDGLLQWYLNVLWKFLVGFYIGRRGLLQDAARHRAAWRRLFPWALGIGLLASAAWVAAGELSPHGLPDSSSAIAALASIPGEIGVFTLALGYLSGLVLLYQRPWWQARLAVLAPVGRMALTNYLLQSVLLIMLFYGTGLGLLGDVGAAACLALSLLQFTLQVVLSAWWLQRFRFGPVEWVWRRLTYGGTGARGR